MEMSVIQSKAFYPRSDRPSSILGAGILFHLFNLYGHYVLRYETSLTIFSLQTQQIEVRFVAIKSAFLSHSAYTPFNFSRTLPLRQYNLNELCELISYFIDTSFKYMIDQRSSTLFSLYHNLKVVVLCP